MSESKPVLFSVTGRVALQRDYCLEELLLMDSVGTEEVIHACGSGEPKGKIEACRGVLLTDVINGTEVLIGGHNDTKKMYVIVSSDDGYATVFSWQELYNTEVGAGVIFILERGGVKIDRESDRVDLFSSKDFLSGPRYVKNVKNIEIVMVDL